MPDNNQNPRVHSGSIKLADRFWQCDCAELVQRDANAALNIRDEAIRNLVPADRGEFTLRKSVSP